MLIARARPRRRRAPMSLLVWPTAGGPATPGTINGRDVIAADSALEWTPDGSASTSRCGRGARESGGRRSRLSSRTDHRALLEGAVSRMGRPEPGEPLAQRRSRSIVATGRRPSASPSARSRTIGSSRDGSFVRRSGRRHREDRLRHDRRHREQPQGRGPEVRQPANCCCLPKDLKGVTLRWSDDGKRFAYAKRGEVFVQERGRRRAAEPHAQTKAGPREEGSGQAGG